MSIKKSLRISLILLVALPLILMTMLSFIFSCYKFNELNEYTSTSIAKNYSRGLTAQLDIQVTRIEGLSNSNELISYLLDNYNTAGMASVSHYFDDTYSTIVDSAAQSDNHVQYYLYDSNGYLLISSDYNASEDWSEYMTTNVSDIKKISIMKSSNISRDSDSIDIVAPITYADRVIGLIRANIPSSYFSTFIPDDGSAFVMTEDGKYLFSSIGFSHNTELEDAAIKAFDSDNHSGTIVSSDNKLKTSYVYTRIDNLNWIYILKMDSTIYSSLLTTLPLVLFIVLAIFLLIAFKTSNMLTNKYTQPILILKDKMTAAADGQLDVKCDITSDDEFGDLSLMFNNMMKIISNNYNELNSSKKILEENEIELKKNYNHIEQLAYHDGLTGLYNRVAFMKNVYSVFHNMSNKLEKHAIFFIDLDNFKNINDTLGHDYGDILLQQVANKLSSYIESDDILARTGGDEFLILKRNIINDEDLESFAAKLINIATSPFKLNDETANISISVGISIFPRDGLSINELIKNADIAMYAAKNSGKNNFMRFNSTMEDEVNRKNDLSDVLSSVIDNNEIFLLYQPQANVSTGKITGFEALMRIDSDIFGRISPTEFIPVAEDSGLINELGEWALIEACSFNQQLIDKGFEPIKVSVNVSTEQLKGTRLFEVVRNIPSLTGMNLKYLEIEITESVLMNSFDHHLELINKFKSLGVSIALDDFGTGYSSFNYLTQIPIDTLKIDKSFIDRICDNDKDKCIADTIISLAHKMNITVVAEGVENDDQLKILQNQLCDTLQGYLFSKPINSTDFLKLMKRNQ